MGDPLFTPGQFDLLSVDRHDIRRGAKPATPIVQALTVVFKGYGQRHLYLVAGKLYQNCGTSIALLGINYIKDNMQTLIEQEHINPIVLIPRIEQAGAALDNLPPHLNITTEQILADMTKLKVERVETAAKVVDFLRELHTSHPVMKKYISAATDTIIKDAFRIDRTYWTGLVSRAIEDARSNKGRCESIKRLHRTPKETATWVVQIMLNIKTNEG